MQAAFPTTCSPRPASCLGKLVPCRSSTYLPHGVRHATPALLATGGASSLRHISNTPGVHRFNHHRSTTTRVAGVETALHPGDVKVTDNSVDPYRENFAWTQCWWPLLPLDVLQFIAADKPAPVTLLGLNLVVWKDKSGSWCVWRDQCPHRLAPLSGKFALYDFESRSTVGISQLASGFFPVENSKHACQSLR